MLLLNAHLNASRPLFMDVFNVIFALSSSFFTFVMEKRWKKTCFSIKKWFCPANCMQSSRSLVKIHISRQFCREVVKCKWLIWDYNNLLWSFEIAGFFRLFCTLITIKKVTIQIVQSVSYLVRSVITWERTHY